MDSELRTSLPRKEKAVLATDDIHSQFDYQNLSPKPLLTT